jgi:hypothetical protein
VSDGVFVSSLNKKNSPCSSLSLILALQRRRLGKLISSAAASLGSAISCAPCRQPWERNLLRRCEPRKRDLLLAASSWRPTSCATSLFAGAIFSAALTLATSGDVATATTTLTAVCCRRGSATLPGPQEPLRPQQRLRQPGQASAPAAAAPHC